MRRRLLVASILTASLALVVFASASSAGSAPSGQRMYGNTSFDPVSGHFTGGGGTIEPAYDDSTGTLVYLRTPNNAKSAKNLPKKMVPFPDLGSSYLGFSLPVNVAPIFLPVYPKGWFSSQVTLNCSDVPENCPDHGPGVAGGAAFFQSSVYGPPDGSGVLGHDHLVGVAKTGGDFNVLWEPVLVLFTNTTQRHDQITTLAQITALYKSGDVQLVPNPSATFPCSVEGPAAYEKATPVGS